MDPLTPVSLLVGDVVELVSTTDLSRRHLVSVRGTVVATQEGNQAVLGAVVFEGETRRCTVVAGIDDLRLIDRPGQPVVFTTRRPAP